MSIFVTIFIDIENFRFHKIDRQKNHETQFEKNAKLYNIDDNHIFIDDSFMNSFQFVAIEKKSYEFENDEKYFKQKFRLR